MHPLFQKSDKLSNITIGAAIEVHKNHGAGLLESIYEWSLMIELKLLSIETTNQKSVEIQYKGHIKKELLRFDILIDQCLLVETKAVDKIIPIHKAQLLSYMKLLNVPLGLIINFNQMKLADGVHRLILQGADSS